MQPPTFSLLVYYSVLKIGKNSFVLLQRNSYFRRFTPDQLGIHASWIIIWNIIENCCLCLIVFFLNVELKLRILDLIAYCGYKYVGVTAVLISFLVTRSIWIYRYAMIYSSLTISYFLVRFFPCVIHRFDFFLNRWNVCDYKYFPRWMIVVHCVPVNINDELVFFL